jgi:hypothetical protein
MKESGRKGREMDRESIYGQMEHSI